MLPTKLLGLWTLVQSRFWNEMKIDFQKVSKTYGLVQALSNVSFAVESGEFVFIVGPSGAGKSTLIKLILNQVKPDDGSVVIDNIDLSKATRRQIDTIRRQIGVVFQDYQLISDKTVEENISLALDIAGFPNAQRPAKISQVIEQVNLSSRRFLFPSQLSGGELQRACLARALAVDPKVILADEPTGNLDPDNIAILMAIFREINKKTKATVIMTTHNQDIIGSTTKRIITLKNGTISNDIKK